MTPTDKQIQASFDEFIVNSDIARALNITKDSAEYPIWLEMYRAGWIASKAKKKS